MFRFDSGKTLTFFRSIALFVTVSGFFGMRIMRVGDGCRIIGDIVGRVVVGLTSVGFIHVAQRFSMKA